MELSTEEREHLSTVAARRSRTAIRVVVLATVAVVVGATGLGLMLAGSMPDGPLEWVLLAVPLVVLLALVAVLARWLRRTRRPLMAGADRDTRRAVQQALRAGGTDDPRVDALVRDAVDSSAPQLRVALIAQSAAAVLLLAAAILSDQTVLRLVFALAAVAQVAAVVGHLVTRRRMSAYRGPRGV